MFQYELLMHVLVGNLKVKEEKRKFFAHSRPIAVLKAKGIVADENAAVSAKNTTYKLGGIRTL